MMHPTQTCFLTSGCSPRRQQRIVAEDSLQGEPIGHALMAVRHKRRRRAVTYCKVRLRAPRRENPPGHGASSPSLRNLVRYAGENLPPLRGSTILLSRDAGAHAPAYFLPPLRGSVFPPRICGSAQNFPDGSTIFVETLVLGRTTSHGGTPRCSQNEENSGTGLAQ